MNDDLIPKKYGLIDANELWRKVLNNDTWYENADIWIVQDIIYSMPTIDPVKHGYWTDYNCGWAKCSVCGEWFDHFYDDDTKIDYCPHCGARMDEGEEND